MRMVLGWLAGALLAGTAPAAPPMASDVTLAAEVRAKLADYDLNRAAQSLSALIEARLPTKPDYRPDPLLDRLFVEALLTGGNVPLGGAIVDRLAADARDPDHGRFQLIRATVRERLGDFPGAIADYRALASDPKTAGAATLGLARLQMMDDPAAALATLAAMPISPAGSWEPALLRARALRMLGQQDQAKAAIDAAWAAAPLAPAADAAIARIAIDRAVIAAAAGDRPTTIAMLAVDRFGRSGPGVKALAEALPVCHAGGIEASDRVTIAFSAQPRGFRPRVELIAASRPGIAALFLKAAGDPAVPDMTGQVNALELRCRQAPSGEYPPQPNAFPAIENWLTSQGVYIDPANDQDQAASSQAARLAAREARYGPNSLYLLPPLMRLLAGTIGEGLGGDAARTQSVELARRILTILAAKRAPSSQILMMRLAVLGMEVATQSKPVAEAQAEYVTLFRQTAADGSIPVDVIYLMSTGPAADTNVPAALRQAILEEGLHAIRQRAGIADPRTLAVAIKLARAKRDAGDRAGASATASNYKLPGDACALMETPPRFVSAAIRSEDYPGDLMMISLEGLSLLEFSVAPSGEVMDLRLLATAPTAAFDAISLERGKTIRFDPARRDGQATTCRGATQVVRWQIPS